MGSGSTAREATQGTLRGFIAGLIIAMLLVSWPVFAPATSTAATCYTVGTGWEGTYDGSTNKYGVRVGSSAGAGLKVTTPDTQCAQVRSLYVWQGANNFVEIGWYEDAGVLGGCPDVSTAHEFVYAMIGGSATCMAPNDALSAGYHDFRVDNPDHDLDFSYYIDGTLQENYAVNFSRGEIFSGTERHTPSESVWAEFDGLRFLGGQGNWNDWDVLTGNKRSAAWDSVNDYAFCKVNNHHYLVKQVC